MISGTARRISGWLFATLELYLVEVVYERITLQFDCCMIIPELSSNGALLT